MPELAAARALFARVPVRAPVDKTSAADQGGARILIVEDDYFVGLELEHRLADAGYEVVGVTNTAGDAVAMAAAEKPVLAIVDIRLAAGGDGIDAAVEMFSKLGVRSIFATAHGDAATRARAERAHPAGWLLKPYSAEALLAAVAAALTS
jgi:DNA-binding NarL/FixJ family response regulator